MRYILIALVFLASPVHSMPCEQLVHEFDYKCNLGHIDCKKASDALFMMACGLAETKEDYHRAIKTNPALKRLSLDALPEKADGYKNGSPTN